MRSRFFPSLLSADFSQLQNEIDRASPFVDGFHVDVMDGHFVPNLTMGAPVLRCLRSKKPFDVHLMVMYPDSLIPDFAEAGASSVSVHIEACPHIHRTLQHIRDHGMRAGVALNPGTGFCAAQEAIALADFVLVMSVNPGFSGQQFLPSVLPKISALHEAFPEKEIQVDGGLHEGNISRVRAAGASCFVSGSYFWGAADLSRAAAFFQKEEDFSPVL